MAHRNIKYTAAEKASFALLPETCPAIEDAFDKAFRAPGPSDEQVTTILAKYNIVPDKQLGYAINELLSRLMFERKTELLNVVRYEGTFPLRLALVNQIEQAMAQRNEPVPPNHYAYWIDQHRQGQAFRASRAAQH